MDINVEFLFRHKNYCCDIYIDTSEDPMYIFIQLHDTKLIDRFGTDITIKTDFEQCLPFHDDFYPDLIELRTAIFDTVKTIPESIAAKAKLVEYNYRHYGNMKSTLLGSLNTWSQA